jgi:hypothetical protein
MLELSGMFEKNLDISKIFENDDFLMEKNLKKTHFCQISKYLLAQIPVVSWHLLTREPLKKINQWHDNP